MLASKETTLDAAKSGSNDLADEQEWRRILWARQPYPDNFVPPDFLQSLKHPEESALPTFSALVLGSLPLTQRLGTTLTFVGIFLHLRDDLITSRVLASLSVAGMVLCGATMPTSRAATQMPTTVRDGASSSSLPYKPPRRSSQPLSYALLGLFILAVSPLLKTLTEATTSDSIAALSTTLFLISFALADFSRGIEQGAAHAKPIAPRQTAHDVVPGDDALLMTRSPLPATLSLNAALCASTVLASRLASPISVFSLVLLAILLFAFLPRWIKYHVARQASRGAIRRGHLIAIAATVSLLVSSTVLLLRFSTAAAVTDVIVAAFLSGVCPCWMRRSQQFKVSRRGPWDVSVPRLRPARASHDDKRVCISL